MGFFSELFSIFQTKGDSDFYAFKMDTTTDKSEWKQSREMEKQQKQKNEDAKLEIALRKDALNMFLNWNNPIPKPFVSELPPIYYLHEESAKWENKEVRDKFVREEFEKLKAEAISKVNPNVYPLVDSIEKFNEKDKGVFGWIIPTAEKITVKRRLGLN